MFSSYLPLQRADHSFRGHPPTVMSLIVCALETLTMTRPAEARVRPLRHRKWPRVGLVGWLGGGDFWGEAILSPLPGVLTFLCGYTSSKNLQLPFGKSQFNANQHAHFLKHTFSRSMLTITNVDGLRLIVKRNIKSLGWQKVFFWGGGLNLTRRH